MLRMLDASFLVKKSTYNKVYIDEEFLNQLEKILSPQKPEKKDIDRIEVYTLHNIPLSKAIKAFEIITQRFILDEEIRASLITPRKEIDNVEELKKYFKNFKKTIKRKAKRYKNFKVPIIFSIYVRSYSRLHLATLDIYLEVKEMF